MPDSKQLNSYLNPHPLLTKRTSLAAPTIGLYKVVTFGPRTYTASAAPAAAHRIDIPFRLAGFCWSTSSIDGGVASASFRILVLNAAVGGSATGIHAGNVNLLTSPAGVLYFKTVTGTNDTPERSGAGGGHNTNPYLYGQSITTGSHLKFTFTHGGGGNVNDFYLAVFGWTVDYMNAENPTNLFKALPSTVD